MKCTHCDEEIRDDSARWAWDEPYCENCFENLFNYCCRCDSVINRDETHYNADGDPYCSDCWDEDFDDDAPNNPNVFESDREHIIHLSRSWLQGKTDTRRFISINQKDYFLKTLRGKVGLVGSPLYIFGLTDRDEYQISASQNIMEDVKEFLLFNLPEIKVTETFGSNRLGISFSLRKENLPKIIELIKQITSVKETVTAA